jgi:hypothetical protein
VARCVPLARHSSQQQWSAFLRSGRRTYRQPEVVLGKIRAQIEGERLNPLAEEGLAARGRLKRGGQGATKARERNQQRLGWRQRARRLDSMMDDDMSRKERAVTIAGRLKTASWRTVYDALPPRRSRKSSR